MSARPAGADWQPLGLDADPVPGDPGQVHEEADHLSSVARQIADQVAMLRKIAAQGTEVGQHADTIRSTASSLAGKLEQVGGRYQKVASALSAWGPELAQAQSMSLQALDQAEVPYKQLNQPAMLPSGANLTAAQKRAVSDYHSAMSRAQDDLDAAKALLGKAISLRDEQGSHYAAVINRACDDGLKDSWWDHFKDIVAEWSWLIKDVCTGLEIAATVAAVAALFLTGAGEALLIAGAIITAAALLGRTALAATGNGSWTDVALDATGLLSFGVGNLGTKLLGRVVEGMTEAAKGYELTEVAPLMEKIATVFGEGVAGRVQEEFLAKVVPEVSEEAKTSVAERLIAGAGDRKVVNLMKTASQLEAKFDDSPVVSGLGKSTTMLRNLLRANYAFANAVSAVPLVGGGVEIDGPNGSTPVDVRIPVVGDLWHEVEDDTTTQGGISTRAANTAINVITATAPPPVSLPLQGFRWALSHF